MFALEVYADMSAMMEEARVEVTPSECLNPNPNPLGLFSKTRRIERYIVVAS